MQMNSTVATEVSDSLCRLRVVGKHRASETRARKSPPARSISARARALLSQAENKETTTQSTPRDKTMSAG